MKSLRTRRNSRDAQVDMEQAAAAKHIDVSSCGFTFAVTFNERVFVACFINYYSMVHNKKNQQTTNVRARLCTGWYNWLNADGPS